MKNESQLDLHNAFCAELRLWDAAQEMSNALSTLEASTRFLTEAHGANALLERQLVATLLSMSHRVRGVAQLAIRAVGVLSLEAQEAAQ